MVSDETYLRKSTHAKFDLMLDTYCGVDTTILIIKVSSRIGSTVLFAGVVWIADIKNEILY